MGKPTAFVGSLAMIPMYSSPMFCQLPTPPAGPGHPPHPAPPGPLLVGAPTVSVNGLPVGRKNDTGLIICCPCNFQFTVTEGSSSVEACNQPVSRIGDKVQHMADAQKQAKIILGMPVILTGCGGTDANALQFPWFKSTQAGQVNAAKAPFVSTKGKAYEVDGKLSSQSGPKGTSESGSLVFKDETVGADGKKKVENELELHFHHDSNGKSAAGMKYKLEGPAGEVFQGVLGDDGKIAHKGKPGLWRIVMGGETYRSAALAAGGSSHAIPVPTSLSDVALSKKRLYLGGSVDIAAKVRGVPDGAKARIELRAEHAPDRLVTSIDAVVKGGEVKGTWKATLDKVAAHPDGTNLEIHVLVDNLELHDVSVQTIHVDTAAMHFGF